LRARGWQEFSSTFFLAERWKWVWMHGQVFVWWSDTVWWNWLWSLGKLFKCRRKKSPPN
jgi:hypothetical protein